MFHAARRLPLLKVLLGSFHVAHSARLSTQQGLYQISLIILGDDVLNIKLLIGRKAAANLGGVKGLHINVCLRSLGFDQCGLGLGLVNRSLFRITQAPQRVELQLIVGFLRHVTRGDARPEHNVQQCAEVTLQHQALNLLHKVVIALEVTVAGGVHAGR